MPSIVPALILAPHGFTQPTGAFAKHLVRGSDRFKITAVVDPSYAEEDAGRLLDGKRRGIPITHSIDEAIDLSRTPPEYCIIGLQSEETLSPPLLKSLTHALDEGLALVHAIPDFSSHAQDLLEQAKEKHLDIIDLYTDINESAVTASAGSAPQHHRKIAIIGTHQGIGTSAVTRLVKRVLTRQKIETCAFYTNASGWLHGLSAGINQQSYTTPKDALNALQALIDNPKHHAADALLIDMEMNTGECLLDEAPTRDEHFPDYVILHHTPTLADDLLMRRAKELIRHNMLFAITLNTEKLDADEIAQYKQDYSQQFSVPVIAPFNGELKDIAEQLVKAIKSK